MTTCIANKDVEIHNLLKVPDSVVIAELRRELKQKDIELGQANSYIQELEEGLIDRIEVKVDSCRKCSEKTKHLKALEVRQADLKKKLAEYDNLPIKNIEELKELQSKYRKEIQKNERLQSQLLSHAREIIKLKELI